MQSACADGSIARQVGVNASELVGVEDPFAAAVLVNVKDPVAVRVNAAVVPATTSERCDFDGSTRFVPLLVGPCPLLCVAWIRTEQELGQCNSHFIPLVRLRILGDS